MTDMGFTVGILPQEKLLPQASEHTESVQEPKNLFRAKNKRRKTCIYGSEKNCVGTCPFYILNEEMLRKDIVEIRKLIDSNNKYIGYSVEDR
jgi:hypothetical protein